MTRYDWICNECEVIWERDCRLGEAPKRTKCPECGELRNRNWGSVSNFQMLGDCHTNRVRDRNFQINGMDKDTAEDYYAGAIKNSKAGVNSGWQHYSKMTPDYKDAEEKGLLQRRSDTEVKQAVERSKKMTEAVYNDIDVDIQESATRKPQ